MQSTFRGPQDELDATDAQSLQNNIGSEGAKHLSEALKTNSTLQTLDLFNNHIGRRVQSTSLRRSRRTRRYRRSISGPSRRTTSVRNNIGGGRAAKKPLWHAEEKRDFFNQGLNARAVALL